MKLIGFFLLFVLTITKTNGQTDQKTRYFDASQLTMIGKALPTPHLYHRIDATVYGKLTPSENQQARSTAGLALTFSTNSTFIELLPTYKWEHKKDNMTGIAAAGFDLYIKRDNKWVYAGTGAPRIRNKEFYIIKNMDTTEKECLLYLPIYSELESLKIGIEKTATIKAIPNPFKSKIVFFGSSFTQGTSASRPGMSYPMQIERNLDVHVCNLGFAGNAKLQPYFAELVADIDADAFVFDAFSNPNEEMIRERLKTFIEIIRKKHKKTPLIFVHTIHRGNTNFNLEIRKHEEKKKEAVKKITTELVEKFPNIYLLESPLPESISVDTSADGVHPSDLGYYYWANNLGDKLKELLDLSTQSKEDTFQRGEGSIEFTRYEPLKDKPVTIHYYIPIHGNIQKMPVLFSMHRAGRNGLKERNAWKSFTEDSGFIVLAPQYSKEYYEENDYQFGGVSESSDKFIRELIVQVGTTDTIQVEKGVSTSDVARIQGVHRYERGWNFFEQPQTEAQKRGLPFNWKIVDVEGVGHSSIQMVHGKEKDTGAYSLLFDQ